jgi:2-furoyl-CoA dehydrogenase FAD binding subunit
MKPAAFDYIRVDALDEALEVLADPDLEAKVLAGGQSLIPMMNMRLAAPKTLLDVNSLAELRAIQPHTRDGHKTLRIGALVRQRELERESAADARARLLYAALTHIGHPQTRTQGTVGGSIAHADPSAELPLVFLTLGGTATARSAQGQRHIPAEEFFRSVFMTALAAEELLTAVELALPAEQEGIAFAEFRRRHGDFALIAAACVMAVDGDRNVERVRLGLGGVGETPHLLAAAQELVGQPCTPRRTHDLATALAEQLDLVDDLAASSAYRRQLVTVLVRGVLQAAYADALGKEGGHAARRA